VLRRGTGTITAAPASAEEARLLGIRTGDPLLVEQRVIVDAYGQRIESTRSVYSADRYALDVQFDVDASDVESGEWEDHER
jgi:GntR family transcriptional regulator